MNSIPTLIPVASFLAYLLLMRQPLSAAQAFTALSLFNILRFPLFQLPQIVTQVQSTNSYRVKGNAACNGSSSRLAVPSKQTSTAHNDAPSIVASPLLVR